MKRNNTNKLGVQALIIENCLDCLDLVVRVKTCQNPSERVGFLVLSEPLGGRMFSTFGSEPFVISLEPLFMTFTPLQDRLVTNGFFRSMDALMCNQTWGSTDPKMLLGGSWIQYVSSHLKSMEITYFDSIILGSILNIDVFLFKAPSSILKQLTSFLATEKIIA